MYGEMVLFSGNANPDLARAVGQSLGQPLAPAQVGRFSDGETRVELQANVRGRDVFLIQPTCAPVNNNLMELLIMAEACKRSSAGRVTAVLPYFGYARQDRKVAPRAPISARLVADLLQAAGIERVLTMDLHAGQIQGFFDMPVDNLYARGLFFRFLREEIAAEPERTVIVSPDAGGVERARGYASLLKCGLAIIDKRRPQANEAEIMHIVGDVEGRRAILIDDMIDTAGTMTKGARALVEHGASSVYACATHAVLSGPAIDRLRVSAFERVIVTDSIPLSPTGQSCDKLQVISVAPLFAEAIRSIHFNDSISRLFLTNPDD